MANKETAGSQDAVEATLSLEGAKVSAKGDGAGRLSNALADALSPFSEAAGALGDTIRAYRTENVIRATARAREIAAQHKIALQPVAPKFLVQWAEGASLEEPGPDDLSELWANLLVSSVAGVKPTHHMFKRMLTEMTGRHLQLLKWVCGVASPSVTFNFGALENNAAHWNELFGITGTKVHRVNDTHEPTMIELAERVNSDGLRLISFDYGPSGAPVWHLRSASGLRIDTEAEGFMADHSADYLTRVGILEDVNGLCRMLTPDNARHAMDMKAWHVTNLGLEFLRACTNAGAK